MLCMDRIWIYLFVCVYVCVSVTRLQVRHSTDFYTVDSLKDADLRKDVPSNSYIFKSMYQIDMKFDKQLWPATETS